MAPLTMSMSALWAEIVSCTSTGQGVVVDLPVAVVAVRVLHHVDGGDLPGREREPDLDGAPPGLRDGAGDGRAARRGCRYTSARRRCVGPDVEVW